MITKATAEDWLRDRGLRASEALRAAYCFDDDRLPALLHRPADDAAPTRDEAEEIIAASRWPLDPHLVPLIPVDERSYACVVASPAEGPSLPGEGAVVRWHLDAPDVDDQAALLDVRADLYLESVAEELGARGPGLARMLDEIGPSYQAEYLDEGRRPRDFAVRPVRIACQNVIVALGAFAHDSTIDGMAVAAWQTCEVPHVAAHEGARALAALMLCDAFRSGGTMEIRFDRPVRVAVRRTTRAGESLVTDTTYPAHPERAVPASLRRYGRTVGVALGARDPAAISPAEARELFLAVTPMPAELAGRVRRAVDAGLATPERLCFVLLSRIWSEVELDLLLGVSPRAGSLLRGGAAWTDRPARQAECEIGRAALMVGMFHRRVDGRDHGDTDEGPRVVEDRRRGVTWSVLPGVGGVRLDGVAPGAVPWTATSLPTDGTVLVLPRATPSGDDVALAASLVPTTAPSQPVALLIPADADVDEVAAGEQGVRVLRCPDRLARLDAALEARLRDARVSRA